MRKIVHIALTEYRQFVVTKTFLLSVVLMPIVMGGIFGVQILGSQVRDLEERRFAVVDDSGVIYEHLLEYADVHNRYERVGAGPVQGVTEERPKFLPEYFIAEGLTDEEVVAALSEKVREELLFAFVVIEDWALDPERASSETAGIRYYTANPAHQALPQWLERKVNEAILDVRFTDAGYDRQEVMRISQWADFERFGLSGITEDGGSSSPEKENELMVYALPMGILILLFICANMSTPLMLNSVIEEKMNKIAEVLVASVTPFQLILGKLLGTVCVGLTLSFIYLGSTLALLSFSGLGDWISFSLVFWFFVFLFLTLMSLGSVWAGIGAACSQIKDTQNFTGIAALFVVLPMVLSPVILLAPHSMWAKAISFVPPSSSFLLMMRIAMPPGVAAWEIALGVILNILFTLFCVWAGARVFRVGLLNQGQTPSLRELLRWLGKDDLV